MRLRFGLALVLTVLVTPVVMVHMPPFVPSPNSQMTVLRIAIAMVHEVLLGAAMGFAARIILAAAQLAGTVIESLCGMSFSMLDGSQHAEETGSQVLSQLFWWTTMAVFIASGGASEVIGSVIQSFRLWPPGTGQFNRNVLDFLVTAVNTGFEFGIRSVLPGLVALLVAGAVLGITQRNCPQLGGMQIGLGLKSIAGLLITSLLLLSTPWMIGGGMELTLEHLQHLLTGRQG
jgi:flagellar biosynthetic protein FliR